MNILDFIAYTADCTGNNGNLKQKQKNINSELAKIDEAEDVGSKISGAGEKLLSVTAGAKTTFSILRLQSEVFLLL